MKRSGSSVTGPRPHQPLWRGGASSDSHTRPALPQVRVPLQAHASPDRLARLLPGPWADSHRIEAQADVLCIQGPQAETVAAQLCHAVDLLGLLGQRGSLATELLMELPGGVTPWQALSIRETPDWGRIQGDAPACLTLLQQLQPERLLLACQLFVRLTPALQLSVLQGEPAFDERFGQRLSQELASTCSLMQLRLSTAQWCHLELQRLECQGLVEAMDTVFRELGHSAVARQDPQALALLLRACPRGTLAALLRAIAGWPALAAADAAEPALAQALAAARSRLVPPGPQPQEPAR